MTKDEIKNRISMALKSPVLQQGFEIICKQNIELGKHNEELIALINAERGRQEKCDDVHLRKIASLEKENAELRTKTNALENANRAMVKELDDMTSGGVSVLENVVRSKEQLTEAKKIIKNLMVFAEIDSREYEKEYKEAEQFLKEVSE